MSKIISVFVTFSLLPCFSWAKINAGEIFIGTSAFMLANLDNNTEEPPNFYQLNFGYQLTDKETIAIEIITWRYYGPLGVSIEEISNPNEKYPGHITGKGAGLAYQRFFWKDLYLALHATLMQQEIYSESRNEKTTGKQLFMALRLGYRFQFFTDAFFLEPSLAITHWPMNDGLPSDFLEVENRWPAFQVEPGLHIGFLF